MRRLIRGERVGSVGVVLGLFVVACVLGSCLSLTLGYRDQVADLKRVIYSACNDRTGRDATITDWARAGEKINRRQAELSRVAANLPPEQMAERTRLFVENADAAKAVVDKQLDPKRCEKYR